MAPPFFQCSIITLLSSSPSSNEKKLPKDIKSVVVAARDLLLLRGLCVAPALPVLLVLRDLLQKLVERLLLAQLHQVQPDDVQHPPGVVG